MRQLRKVGIDKMSLFPELEHAADELKRRAGLHEAALALYWFGVNATGGLDRNGEWIEA
jgi:hypothetical protein